MHEPRSLPTMPYGEFSRLANERALSHDRIIKAQLELTYRCNLHCRHCYTDPYNNIEFFPRELRTSEILQLIDDMAEFGIIWLNLTGGEIFQHPQFWDIYNHAFNDGFLLQLYTNGTLFTKGLVERLKRTPPFTIDISCHSVDEQSFDWFTQVPGSYRSFLRGLNLLQSAGLPFTLKTKAMSWNKNELPAIKLFVESFGQKFGFTTSLSPRLDGDLSSLSYRLPPKDVVEQETIYWGRSNNSATCQNSADLVGAPPNQLYRCGCGTNTIHINAWGEVGTCTLENEHRVSLRQYPLREAVAKVFKEVRRAHYQTNSPCRTCDVFRFCQKKASDGRWEAGSVEAPIPYNCDLAMHRAISAGFTNLIHPLQRYEAQTPVASKKELL